MEALVFSRKHHGPFLTSEALELQGLSWALPLEDACELATIMERNSQGYSRRELRDIERLMREHLETLRHAWTHSAVVTLTLPRVVSITLTEETLSVDLEDGRTIAVPIRWYQRLAHGTPAERTHVQISGAGYSLHWPKLDEDFGMEGLLLGTPSTEKTTSSERWLQRRPAR